MVKAVNVRTDGKCDSDVARLGAVVGASLARIGLPGESANKYALLAMEVYRYLLEHLSTVDAIKAVKDAHDTYDGTKRAFVAARYIERAAAIGSSSAKVGFSAYGASGGAAVLQVFGERFEAFAKAQGIELNECSMALSQLSLDVAAAGIGSATALSGFGAVMTAFAVLGTFQDGYTVGQVCILRNDP